MTQMSLNALAKEFKARLVVPISDGFDDVCTGIAPIDKATASEITFLTNPEFEKYLTSTKAKAVITAKEFPDLKIAQVVHSNPYFVFAKIAQRFAAQSRAVGKVRPGSFVAASAKIGEGCEIYPGASVDENAEIGKNCTLYPGVYVGRGAKLGEGCTLKANVVVEDGCILGSRVSVHANSSIGGDGFGYAPHENEIAKIPQVGIVRIGDDVEIGACTTIDRAAFGETKIGANTKIDSNVHIAHNVQIGSSTMICGSTSLAGSVKIGNRVILAGQVGVDNGASVGDDIKIGGRGGVTKDITRRGDYMGFPAIPAAKWRREMVGIRKVEELLKRVKELENKLSK